MDMFRGRFEYTIDSKGRISIPAKFRDVLNGKDTNGIFVTNEFDGCLVAYPIEEWRKLEEKVSNLNDISKEVKDFQRFFISSAVQCHIDKQGRILIPPALRDYAQLRKDVVFVGMLSKFEIWSKENWKVIPDNMDEMRKAVADVLQAS
jgi:MraZ protein